MEDTVPDFMEHLLPEAAEKVNQVVATGLVTYFP